jgi:hypothetical protein
MLRGMLSINSSEGDKKEKEAKEEINTRKEKTDGITAEELLEGTYDEDGIIPGNEEEWYKKTDWWKRAIADFNRKDAKDIARVT